MIVAFVAVVCAGACVAASARRLLLVHRATALDLDAIVVELRGDAGARRGAKVAAALANEPSWEGGIARALALSEPMHRVAELNELLTELDFQLSRWSRVPRVCASLSSSAGFLLAAALLREGLADPTALSGDVGELVTSGLVGQALTVVGFGLAGAVACAALKARADRAAKMGSLAADAFVERLEELAERARSGEPRSARLDVPPSAEGGAAPEESEEPEEPEESEESEEPAAGP